jgi:hypothetical protein
MPKRMLAKVHPLVQMPPLYADMILVSLPLLVGAVVTKNVPAYALLVGNPARQIGWMSEYGQRLQFDETGKATCAESGQVYELQNGQVKRIS